MNRNGVHQMKLNPGPFAMIKSGEKTIELRLYDEKRQQIKVGDSILFTSTATGERIYAAVKRLHRFDSFEALYKALPLEISDLCDEILGCSVFKEQLLRASADIGANVHVAKYAPGRGEVISRLETALKELYETEYWLELLYKKNKMTEDRYRAILESCNSIRRRIGIALATAKTNKWFRTL